MKQVLINFKFSKKMLANCKFFQNGDLLNKIYSCNSFDKCSGLDICL